MTEQQTLKIEKCSTPVIIIACMTLIAGLAFGIFIGHAIPQTPKPVAEAVVRWEYRSGPGDNVVIDLKTGETKLGPHYDRTTEAKKLFEAVMQMHRQGQIPECHETGYFPPENGMRRIDPGAANPAPPITEQQL